MEASNLSAHKLEKIFATIMLVKRKLISETRTQRVAKELWFNGYVLRRRMYSALERLSDDEIERCAGATREVQGH